MIKERIIKHWITTGIGLVIIIVTILLFAHGRLSAWELAPAVLIGLALFRTKDSWIKGILKYVFGRDMSNNSIDQTFSNLSDNE